MQVRVDTDRCIGNGMCAVADPDHFALPADGVLRIVRSDADPADDRLQEAMDICPMAAISLADRP